MPCPFASFGGPMPAGHPQMSFGGSAAPPELMGFGGCPVFSSSSGGFGGCPVMSADEPGGRFTSRKVPIKREKNEILDLLEAADVVIQFKNTAQESTTRPLRGDLIAVQVETCLYPEKKVIEAAKTIEVTIGDPEAAICDGLHWALRHLEIGAEAFVVCSSEYAYGAKGKNTEPKIPPNSTIRFDVKILECKKEGPEFWVMTSEERIKHMQSILAEADKLFDKKKFELCAKILDEAITRFDCAWLMEENEKPVMKQLEIDSKILAAKAHSKWGGKKGAAVKILDDFLEEIDNTHTEANVLKAKCLWRDGEHDKALDHLIVARTFVQDPPAIDEVTEEIKKDIEIRKEAATFSRKARSKLAKDDQEGADSALEMARAYRDNLVKGNPTLSSIAAALVLITATMASFQLSDCIVRGTFKVSPDELADIVPTLSFLWVLNCGLGIGELADAIAPWQVPTGGSLIPRGLVVFLLHRAPLDISYSPLFFFFVLIWIVGDVVQQIHALVVLRGYRKLPAQSIGNLILSFFALEVVLLSVASFRMRSVDPLSSAVLGSSFWVHSGVFLLTSMSAIGQYLFTMDSQQQQREAEEAAAAVEAATTQTRTSTSSSDTNNNNNTSTSPAAAGANNVSSSSSAMNQPSLSSGVNFNSDAGNDSAIEAGRLGGCNGTNAQIPSASVRSAAAVRRSRKE